MYIILGTDVVGVLHCLVGRTSNVGHILHHEFSSGKNAFLKCRTPTVHRILRIRIRTPVTLYFTQPVIRTIVPSLTGSLYDLWRGYGNYDMI